MMKFMDRLFDQRNSQTMRNNIGGNHPWFSRYSRNRPGEPAVPGMAVPKTADLDGGSRQQGDTKSRQVILYIDGEYVCYSSASSHTVHTKPYLNTRSLNIETSIHQPIHKKTSSRTNKMAEGSEPFTYFAKITFGVICFIWLLATIFCTPVGRWLRCANPRARRPFYYNPAGAAEEIELNELDGGSARSGGRATRRVIDVNDMRNWREGALGSGSSTTAEYEFEF